jgi:type II secretion system protein G
MSRLFSSLSGRRGFTLIELLIVVAIIAILAAIAVPNFLEAQVRSKVARVKADHRSLATALEAYRVDNNVYPPSQFSRVPAATLVGGVTSPIRPYVQRLVWITTPIAYITSAPFDPFAPEIKGAVPNPATPIDTANPSFVYWDDKYMDGRKNSPSNSNPSTNQFRDLPGEFTRRGAYALVSFGPDRGFEAAKVFNAPWPVYDPTNGTVSDGDIFRFGGSGTAN